MMTRDTKNEPSVIMSFFLTSLCLAAAGIIICVVCVVSVIPQASILIYFRRKKNTRSLSFLRIVNTCSHDCFSAPSQVLSVALFYCISATLNEPLYALLSSPFT